MNSTRSVGDMNRFHSLSRPLQIWRLSIERAGFGKRGSNCIRSLLGSRLSGHMESLLHRDPDTDDIQLAQDTDANNAETIEQLLSDHG